MRMLIIEDDIANADFLKRAFMAESFAVDVAHDGERGSYLGRVNKYDFIITDNVLPKKLGLDVCREIRKSGKTCPIIIVSVRSEIPEKIKLIEAGADDYVLKPYSWNELLARVWANLRRTEILAKAVMRIGNVTIDMTAEEVKRDDLKESIYLTSKEFALLALLAKNQGETVSRETILEQVWDMEGKQFSRTVDTHILNLRKKVIGENMTVGIETVSGRGYMMREIKGGKKNAVIS